MKRLIAVAALVLIVAGCSSGTSSGGGLFLGGTWVGLLLDTTASNHRGHVRVNLAQSQDDPNVYSGTAEITGTSCWVGGEWVVTLSGNSVSVAYSDVNGTNVSASGTATNREMKGFFSSTGDPCGAISGEWQLNRQ